MWGPLLALLLTLPVHDLSINENIEPFPYPFPSLIWGFDQTLEYGYRQEYLVDENTERSKTHEFGTVS